MSAPPTIRVLKIIADGLEEIDGHFAWEGLTGINDEAGTGEPLPSEAQQAEDESDEDPYEDPYYTAGFDREDIEIAIDAFLSYLLRKRLIHKNKSGRLPSFAGVFEEFLGEDHQIAKVADKFEEHIKGYFGWIDYENMRAAYAEFLEIRAFIRKELENPGGVEAQGMFDADRPRQN